MPNYRRANTPGATYFFTVVTNSRQLYLTNDDVRKALHDGIESTRKRHPFTIDAWVLLPDHLHCIWTLPTGDSDFSIRWTRIKQHVSDVCAQRYIDPSKLNLSQRKRREAGFWQRRFWEHLIRDEFDYERHVDYIHWNPVKAWLCRTLCGLAVFDLSSLRRAGHLSGGLGGFRKFFGQVVYPGMNGA